MLYDCVRLVNRLWFRTDPRLREWWIILPRRIIQSIWNLFNAVTKNVSTGACVDSMCRCINMYFISNYSSIMYFPRVKLPGHKGQL